MKKAKKLSITAFFCFFLSLAVDAKARLPEEFYITERFFSLFSTFDLETDQKTFAFAKMTPFSFHVAYDIFDLDEKIIASSKTRLFSYKTITDVFDETKNQIGTIEEEIFKIFPWSLYRIFDKEDKLIAIAEMNCIGTKFQIYDPKDTSHLFAEISRPLIPLFSEKWTVKLLDYSTFEQNLFDLRLLSLLAIHQTDRDRRNALYAEFFENLRSHQENFEQ